MGCESRWFEMKFAETWKRIESLFPAWVRMNWCVHEDIKATGRIIAHEVKRLEVVIAGLEVRIAELEGHES